MSGLFIGDNLEIMKEHREEWKESIDVIYIDPPYNTGNVFTYNDNFSEKEDRHTAWLKFMQERLELAKYFLKETGCIYIAIGDDELYRLKILCDDIFGEKNFINNFMWLHGKGKKDTWSRTLTENNLCYARNKEKLKPFVEVMEANWATVNLDNDSRGNWFSGSISLSEKRSNKKHRNYYSITSPSGIVWERQWLVSESKMKELIADNRIFFGEGPAFKNVPREKIFNGKKTEIIPRNIIENAGSTRDAQNYLDGLLGVKGIFDNPKPVDLIMHLIKITDMSKDITVMDFFAGSGTTAESVHKLNELDSGKRQWILIQKDEETYELINGKKVARRGCEKAYEAGYESIAEITKARLKAIKLL